MSTSIFRLPAYYNDHMVLQQRCENRIFGQAPANQPISLTVEHLPSDPEDTADDNIGIVFEEIDRCEEDGYFSFRLPPVEASADTYRFIFRCCEEEHIIEDVCFGEVWLAAGESNMTMPARLTDVHDDMPNLAGHDQVRFFTMNESGLEGNTNAYSYVPVGRLPGGRWFKATASEVGDISAVSLMFGLHLHRELKIPVAVYLLAANDTMMHSWLPREIVEEDKVIKNHTREINFYRSESTWNSFGDDHAPGYYETGDLAAKLPPFTTRNQPSAMYNHKLAPYSGLSIRGMIWMHGESDVQYPKYYRRALQRFAEVVKDRFRSPANEPYFIYSQLAPDYVSDRDPYRLAAFNEALSFVRRKLVTPAGMITLYDLPFTHTPGSEIWNRRLNPRAKRTVAERFASIALGLAYHRDVPSTAPECEYAEQVGDKLMITFANVGKGLFVKDDPALLRGFMIEDAAGKPIPAEAKELYGVRCLVWHDEIKGPQACSYGFSTFNHDANLFGGENMPVVPFRLSPFASDKLPVWDWMACDRLQALKLARNPYAEDVDGDAVIADKRDLWTIRGRAEFRTEADNKRFGAASLYLSYRRADETPIVFGPILDYASDYPPLDLTGWEHLSMEVFNADHHHKYIQMKLTDMQDRVFHSNVLTIPDKLAWQTIVFELPGTDYFSPDNVIKCEFTLTDPSGEGGLFIDRIRPTGHKIEVKDEEENYAQY